jgi:hypothetical protein
MSRAVDLLDIAAREKARAMTMVMAGMAMQHSPEATVYLERARFELDLANRTITAVRRLAMDLAV